MGILLSMGLIVKNDDAQEAETETWLHELHREGRRRYRGREKKQAKRRKRREKGRNEGGRERERK